MFVIGGGGQYSHLSDWFSPWSRDFPIGQVGRPAPIGPVWSRDQPTWGRDVQFEIPLEFPQAQTQTEFM